MMAHVDEVSVCPGLWAVVPCRLRATAHPRDGRTGSGQGGAIRARACGSLRRSTCA